MDVFKYAKGKSGVYKITCIPTGKIYIGSAVDIYRAWVYRHIKDAKNNVHDNFRFQEAFTMYGLDSFRFEVIEYCDKKECTKQEQYYLDTLLFAQEFINSKQKDRRFWNLGYNLNASATSSLGRVTSEETKLKISKAFKGEKHPLFGTKHSPETRKRISEGRKGKVISEEARKRVGEKNKGKKRTEETKMKMSISFKGRVYSQETRERMSKSKMGKLVTDSQKAKMAKIHLGNTKSRKPVAAININTGEKLEFIRVGDCADHFSISYGYIAYLIKNKKCCKNHKFEYLPKNRTQLNLNGTRTIKQ